MFDPAALFAVLSLAASKYHDPVLSPPHLRYLDETRFCCVSTPSVVALTGSYACLTIELLRVSQLSECGGILIRRVS